MNILKRIGINLLILGFASCASEKDTPAINTDSFLNVNGLSKTHWTYLSLTTGKRIGTSSFNSKEEDEEWKKRTDWDIALCGKYLRTNSGTSGVGKGGMLKVEGISYESITIPSQSEFKTDRYEKIK